MTLAEFLTQASASPPAPSATIGSRGTLLRRTLPVAVILHAGAYCPSLEPSAGVCERYLAVLMSSFQWVRRALRARVAGMSRWGGLEERRPLGWTFLCPDSVAD